MATDTQAAEAAAHFAALGVTPSKHVAPAPGSPEFAAFFDHTLLKLDATAEQIDTVCAEATEYGFKSVCVRLQWVERSVQKLKGSNVVVACVVGFHEGTHKTAEKVVEAQSAVAAGAAELDMVMNYPLLQAGDAAGARADIEAVRAAAPSPTVLKVIVETSQLSVAQIVQACEIVKAAGADFIKTSTGFNGRGATVADVEIMRHGMGSQGKVKASGGVRSAADAVRVIEAGADRIGASAGVTIMKQARGQGGPAAGSGY